MKNLIEIRNHIGFQKLKTLKNRLLNVKIIPIVVAIACILSMSVFMNCSMTDGPIEKSSTNPTQEPRGDDGDDGGETATTVSTTTTHFTNPNPPEPPVVGGDASNIVWLHTDVSSWSKTSEITDVKVKENGEVCI